MKKGALLTLIKDKEEIISKVWDDFNVLLKFVYFYDSL